jgi:hypothetical protein
MALPDTRLTRLPRYDAVTRNSARSSTVSSATSRVLRQRRPAGQQREHLPFHLAGDEAVLALHGDEPRPAVQPRQVPHLRELPGPHQRRADVTGLARLDDVVQGFHGPSTGVPAPKAPASRARRGPHRQPLPHHPDPRRPLQSLKYSEELVGSAVVVPGADAGTGPGAVTVDVKVQAAGDVLDRVGGDGGGRVQTGLPLLNLAAGPPSGGGGACRYEAREDPRGETPRERGESPQPRRARGDYRGRRLVCGAQPVTAGLRPPPARRGRE